MRAKRVRLTASFATAAAPTVCCGLATFSASPPLLTAAPTTVEKSLLSGSYTVADLGVVPKIADETALGLNDQGQVTGWHSSKDGSIRAFLWERGHMTELAPPAGFRNSIGRAVNERGEVAGWGNTSANPVDNRSVTHAFLFRQGRIKDLGTLGGRNSQAFAVNDQSQVVGGSNLSPTVRHAFLYDHGKMKDLGALPKGDFSVGYDINRNGHAVGVSTTAGKASHATLWRNGRIEDLGVLPNGKNSYGRAVNNKDQVVGYATWTTRCTPSFTTAKRCGTWERWAATPRSPKE